MSVLREIFTRYLPCLISLPCDLPSVIERYICRGGGMVDTTDLKSVGVTPVPVRVRPSALASLQRCLCLSQQVCDIVTASHTQNRYHRGTYSGDRRSRIYWCAPLRSVVDGGTSHHVPGQFRRVLRPTDQAGACAPLADAGWHDRSSSVSRG